MRGGASAPPPIFWLEPPVVSGMRGNIASVVVDRRRAVDHDTCQLVGRRRHHYPRRAIKSSCVLASLSAAVRCPSCSVRDRTMRPNVISVLAVAVSLGHSNISLIDRSIDGPLPVTTWAHRSLLPKLAHGRSSRFCTMHRVSNTHTVLPISFLNEPSVVDR